MAVEEGTKLHTKNRVTHAPHISADGAVFHFKGGPTGVVKFMEPMNQILNYFELLILHQGQEASIGIGVGEKSYSMSRMPGWNRNSVGYHADDGKLYHESGGGSAFGPTCTRGDVMGCGVDYDTDSGVGYVQVFFTKNGKQFGKSIRVKRPNFGLFPLIGLHSSGERVRYLGHWRRVAHTVLEPMQLDSSPSPIWLRSNGIRFLDNGLVLEYNGNGGNVQDVAMAQSRLPLSITDHYFEMEIVAVGLLTAIAVGLARSTYPMHRHPGWSPGSIGYHADDGKLFAGRGQGEPFGPTCGEGDTIGCGIVFSNTEEEEEGEGGAGDLACQGSSDDVTEVDFHYEGTDDDEEEDPSDLSDFSDYSDHEEMDDMFFHRLDQGRRNRDQIMRVAGQRRNLSQQPQRRSEREEASRAKCEVYFTKNGERVGKTDCLVPRGGFFPVVAMLSAGEKVKVNLQPLTG